MKRVLWIPTLILFSACTKLAQTLDQLTHITLNYEATYTLPATDSVYNNLELKADSIETNIQSRLAANNTSRELIEGMTVKEIKIFIDSPMSQQFDPLTDAEVFISGNHLTEAKVAYVNGISDDINQTLEMQIEGTELKPYLIQDYFNSRVVLKTDQMIPQNTKIRCEMKFTLDAKVLGQ